MGIRKHIVAIAILVAFSSATAENKHYKHLGERPASGDVKTAFYTFSYEAPSQTYDSIEWNAYRDKGEERNSIMVTGLSGYDTYALSVLYKGRATSGQSALGFAEAKYPSLVFVDGPNPACVNTQLDRPFHLDGRMVNIMAMCIDPVSSAAYELSISWQSLILAMNSIDQITNESEACMAAKSADPSERCPDRIELYTKSFRTLISSFAMTGK